MCPNAGNAVRLAGCSLQLWAACLLQLCVPTHAPPLYTPLTPQNSASECALTAAIAARERALRHLAHAARGEANGAITGDANTERIEVSIPVRQQYTSKLVMYGSTQTHSLGAKAALLLGMQFRALPVRVSDDYALRGETLRKAIEEDVKNGFTPFFVSE